MCSSHPGWSSRRGWRLSSRCWASTCSARGCRTCSIRTTRGGRNMDRRAFLATVAGLPSAALLSGCRGPGPDDSRTLRFAYRTDFRSMDPAQCYDAATVQLMRLLNQGLLDCDDQMNLVPWL